MTDVTPLTPDEHRVLAEKDIDIRDSGHYPPSTAIYQNLTLSALYHVMAAIAGCLEPPPEPQIPGMPEGWTITTRQKTDGDRKWGYQLTTPGGLQSPPTRCRWGSQEGALAAGISEARDLAARARVLDEDPGPGDSDTRA